MFLTVMKKVQFFCFVRNTLCHSSKRFKHYFLEFLGTLCISYATILLVHFLWQKQHFTHQKAMLFVEIWKRFWAHYENSVQYSSTYHCHYNCFLYICSLTGNDFKPPLSDHCIVKYWIFISMATFLKDNLRSAKNIIFIPSFVSLQICERNRSPKRAWFPFFLFMVPIPAAKAGRCWLPTLKV